MKQLVYLPVIFLLSILLNPKQLTAQKNARVADSLGILQLKASLPKFSGKDKVNLLNKLTKEYRYFYLAFYEDHFMDSAKKYNQFASVEVEKIDYPFGRAIVLLEGVMSRQWHMKEFTDTRMKIDQAISLGTTMNNNLVLGQAYDALGQLYYEDKKPYASTWKTSLDYFMKTTDREAIAIASSAICEELVTKGKYTDGIEYCEKCLSEYDSTQIRNSYALTRNLMALKSLASVYEAAGDLETAVFFLHKAHEVGMSIGSNDWNMLSEIGELYIRMEKYDSATHYFDTYLRMDPGNPYVKMLYGNVYLKQGKADKALAHFLSLKASTPSRLYVVLGRFLAAAYAATGDYATALRYIRRSSFPDVYLTTQSHDYLFNAYELRYKVYAGLGKFDSAFKYLQKYKQLNDSIVDKQFYWRLNNKLAAQKKLATVALLQKDVFIKDQQLREAQLLKMQHDASITLLEKNNLISSQELQREQLLKQQKEDRILLLRRNNKLLDQGNRIKDQQIIQASLSRNLFAAGLLGILLLGLFMARLLITRRKNEKLAHQRIQNQLQLQKLKDEKKHAELQQQATELEMQALRAQMNPHFIFNCLSSINNYIVRNETEAASDYLTRFSRLIRMVLVNSQKNLVTLEEDLDTLKLYLEMERLRFKNAFAYTISIQNNLEPAAIFIPPLLLQPFCENAVWHGLMNKSGKGELSIRLELHENFLCCIIKDNGVGRIRAAELKSKSAEKQKSMGLEITNSRLALLNEFSENKNAFEMTDIVDENGNIAGTEVTVNIRYRELLDKAV